MTIKKTDKKTSLKKIEANCRNAKKATGAKTNCGKANSSMNATQHGVLSKKLTDTPTMSDEEKKSYEHLTQGLHDTLQPANVLEEMLVDLAATKYWRLQKGLENENAKVEEVLKGEGRALFGGHDPTKKFTSWDNVPSSQLLLISKAANVLIKEIRKNRKVARASFSVFSQVFDQVETPTESEKEGPDFWKNRLDRHFRGVKSASVTDLSKELFIEVPKDDRKPLVTLLVSIRDGIESAALLKHSDELVDMAISVRKAATEITEQTGLQIRYETSLENGLYKALHELQRVQAFRLGESAHVPVAVDVQSPEGSN